MRLRKSAFPALLSLVVLLSACGTNPPAASSAPVGAESQLEASSAQEPGPVLYVPDAAEVVPWEITVSNADLGVSVSLAAPEADVVAALGNDYMLTSWDDGTATIYTKADISLASDITGHINYFSVENGWSFNSQLSVGDSAEKLVALYGEPDSIFNTYSFRKDGQIASYEEESALVTFYTSDGIITGISVSFRPLPPPILVADGICEIYSFTPSEPNSAGGVDAAVSFNNLSERTIKYITFSVTPYNAVDDPVSSEIDGKSTASLRLTGPIEPPKMKGNSSTANWETVWYNNTIRSCKIDSVTIEYMDGEILNLPVV